MNWYRKQKTRNNYIRVSFRRLWWGWKAGR